MNTRNFIVATAGHVDHGKSALVKALTGTDPDRLPEEKARKITIDLGFAELELDGPRGEKLHAGIVDVPGHGDFVKNMIAGVGSVDLALFVVAADDGWMPQTEEHFQILTYLSVRRAVVALTKSDLGNASNRAVEIHKKLAGTPFEHSPIVQTSVVDGGGLGELRRAIASELAAATPQRDLGKPRLFVDRVFSLRGIGTVVTGTLSGGQLSVGEKIFVQPSGATARIRHIESHNREQSVAGPATRTALNLPDLTIEQIRRGDALTNIKQFHSVTSIDALLTASLRTIGDKLAIKNRAAVFLHHGTGRAPARVMFAERSELERGESAIANFQLDSPILAFVGDRFVLRDPSARRTIAGGVILDLPTDSAQFRASRQLELLHARATAPDDVVVAIRSELRRVGARANSDFLLMSNFSAEEIDQAINPLIFQGDVVRHRDIIGEAKHWKSLRAQAATAIDKEHEMHPQLRGLDLATLRTQIANVSPQIFDALIVDLSQNGYTTIDNRIQRTEHRASLPENLVRSAEEIRRLVSEKPFDPPARKQIASHPNAWQALRFLIQQGEVVELNDETVLGRDASEQMQDVVIERLQKIGSATASQLRRAIGTSRRVIIPFLEYLDRKGVTQRVGDERVLAKKAPAAKLADAANPQRN